jgi:hypothetical protein
MHHPHSGMHAGAGAVAMLKNGLVSTAAFIGEFFAGILFFIADLLGFVFAAAIGILAPVASLILVVLAVAGVIELASRF